MINNRNLALDSNILFGSTLLNVDEYYFVQTTDLPGININHQQENTKVGRILLQGDIAEYNPIEISFILDEDLNIWKKIINIIQSYHVPGTNTCNVITGTSWLEIRDNRNNYLFKIILHNSYIRTVNNIEYSTNKENDNVVLRVTLEYDYFTIE